MDSQIFSVLSEQKRLDIVKLLYRHPLPVSDIVDTLHLKQPQVSKHLKVLSNAGSIHVYPVKLQRIYALSPKPFKELDTWLKKYKDVWEGRLNKQDAF